MRLLFTLTLMLWPMLGLAQDWEDQQLFEGAEAQQTLRILSSTDTAFFQPIIDSFLADNPHLAVEYFVTGTAAISPVFQNAPDRYDIVISSAMDLQIKLVNDGYAKPLTRLTLPDWAQWRQSLFAFTLEPATIVVNRKAFEGRTVPQTRQDLLRVLRSDPDLFRGKVGTYDVRDSGLGYLFATQDARASETYWRLTEVMGRLGVRLYCCSGSMIDDVASGNLLVAYNVLGSYAAARQEKDDRFEIILPSNFPTLMMRTGFVSGATSQPAEAESFMQHVIAVQTSTANTNPTALPPLTMKPSETPPPVIALEPALMTYIDALKRRTFIKEWENAVIQ